MPKPHACSLTAQTNAVRAAPALDLGFLLDEVMVREKPLDWDAVLASPVPLKVIASCLETLQPVILEGFCDAADLRTCLRASANVPEVRAASSHAIVPDWQAKTMIGLYAC